MQVHDSTVVAFATDCNSICSCSACYDKKMPKVRELTQLDLFRMKRLVDLIDTPRFGGNKSDFAKAAGYRDSSMVGQLLSGGRPISEKTILKWTEAGLCPQGWFKQEDPTQQIEPALPVNRFSDLPISLSARELDLIQSLQMLADVGREDEVDAIYKAVHESAGVARKMKDHILKNYLPEKERGPRD